MGWLMASFCREHSRAGYRFPITEEMEAQWVDGVLKDQSRTRVVLAIEDLSVALPPWADRTHAVDGASLEVLRKDEEFVLYRGVHSNQSGLPSILLLAPASM